MDLIKDLKNMESYCCFEEVILPNNISKNDLLKSMSFLSPTLIILHGSYLSGKRFSPNGHQDLDVIVVSYKKNFWNIKELYSYFSQNFKNHFKTNIDFNILSPIEFMIKMDSNSLMFQSIQRGFTILSEN